MQRTSYVNFIWGFSWVAFFAALLFTGPSYAQGATVPSKVIFQSSEFVQVLDGPEVASWFSSTHTIAYVPRSFKEIENPTLCPTYSFVCLFSIPRTLLDHIVIAQSPVLDETKTRAALEDLSSKVSRDPVNAKFEQQDGGLIVAVEATPGRILNVEKSLELLQKKVQENTSSTLTLNLAVDTTEPQITAQSLTKLGVKEVVSIGETDFTGSPKNRIYNIKRAIEQYGGVAIAPGEEFSFVKHLGEVDGEHGYLPELVIKNNQTTPEFGGGICQVSTTVFRAALNAGLKITARKNHAYPVRYYKPYGMDATVYIPNPDLRFINNTPGTIIMFPEVEGFKLRFTFYGTKDGRTITLDGPHILESHPDGSMKTVFTEIVKDAAGNTVLSDSFWSNYKSPSLFPHPGESQPLLTTKPADWSLKQWRSYKSIH